MFNNSYRENPNKMQQFIIILLLLVLNKAQHVSGDTAHHQEPKIVQATSGFAYVEGCRTCCFWTLSGSVRYPTTRLLVQF